MNCYDFDRTIFRGDSTVRFMLFLLRKEAGLIRFFPGTAIALMRYAFGRADKTSFKEKLFRSFGAVKDIDIKVSEFWKENIKRIKPWYLSAHREDDVVISASPEFLIKPVCKDLGIPTVIGSVVDPYTGKYTGTNCDGREKVRRFKEIFPKRSIRRFFSDSMTDMPLAEIAEEAFLVKGERLLPWPGIAHTGKSE